MEIEATAQDTISILRVTGYLDTRASSDFERKMLELLQGGARLIAIDFTKLDMITSAGIRVLMMVMKRLGGTDRIALWGLNDQVKVVFSIAGLADVFQVLDTQQAAIERLEKPLASDGAAPGQLSKMARLAMRLLGETDQMPARRRSGEAVSKMTEHVSQLLTKRSNS
jgi:anti-anti-sigma factor